MKGNSLFLSIPILGSILFLPTAFACAPHSPDDVFIARLQAVQKIASTDHYHLTINNSRFIFHGFRTWIMHSKPKQWQSQFPLKNIKKNDLIIGLAYAPDQAKPHNYTVASLARLHCQNDILSIGQPIVPFLAWNRKNNNCHDDHPTSIKLLDGFLAYDQSYYLKKLQTKYPTCQALFSAFPKS